MDLQRLINDMLCSLRGVELGHRRFLFDIVDVAIVRPSRLINQQARRLQTRCHFGELELNCLKLSDSATELTSLFAVQDRFFQSALRKSKRGCADCAAEQIQRLKRN